MHHCDHATLGGFALYGRRHVVPSAVSSAGVYTSPAKFSATCKRCLLPRLAADIDRES